jgi:hypothetical protein
VVLEVKNGKEDEAKPYVPKSEVGSMRFPNQATGAPRFSATGDAALGIHGRNATWGVAPFSKLVYMVMQGLGKTWVFGFKIPTLPVVCYHESVLFSALGVGNKGPRALDNQRDSLEDCLLRSRT